MADSFLSQEEVDALLEGVTGESQKKLTMFLERRLTAMWLLVVQRNPSNAKERPACAASQQSPVIRSS